MAAISRPARRKRDIPYIVQGIPHRGYGKSVEEEAIGCEEEGASVRIDVGLGSREWIPRHRPYTNVD